MIHLRAHYSPKAVTVPTAATVPADDEQLERLAASGELPVAVAPQDDECLTSAEGMPTQAAPPIPDDDKPPTVAAPYEFPEAYSEEPPEWSWRSWTVAWRDAAIIVIAGLALAAAAGFGLWALLDHQTPTPSAPSSTPAPPPAPPPPPTPSTSTSTSTMTVTVSPSTTTLLAPPPQLPTVPNPTLQDQAFEELVRRAGVTTHNRENEIRNAHHLCRALRDGSTKQAEATGWAAADNYVLAPAQIVAVIDAAVAVYCPDQSGAWVYYPQAH